MHYVMNGEYAGFFDIGMVQRNEANAIIVHGTMCLIRRAAMDMAGGWNGDTICEDTDLGLAMIEHGWVTHYTNTRYGYGLLPDTYEAFKKQRHRWAYGGFQIVKKHWRRFLPGASRLSQDQKREFTLGWLNWLGAESLGVLVAILNLIWVPIVAFADIAIPDKILTLPIIAAFLVSLLHFVALYRLRVPVKTAQMLGAMVAAMSVQWTVSRAVAQGLITEHLAFARTSKGGLSRMSIEFQAFWEAVIGVLLLVGAARADRVQSVQGSPRDLHLRGRAGAGKPAVPVGRRDRHSGELAHQRVFILAQRPHPQRGTDRAPAGADADQRVAARRLRDSSRSKLIRSAPCVCRLLESSACKTWIPVD